MGPVLKKFETFGKLMEYPNTKFHVRAFSSSRLMKWRQISVLMGVEKLKVVRCPPLNLQ
jgi:hypothetical protein